MAKGGRALDLVGTNIRLPRSLLGRIDQAADERDLGRNFLIRKLLEESLDRLIPVEELFRRPEPIPEEDLIAEGLAACGDLQMTGPVVIEQGGTAPLEVLLGPGDAKGPCDHPSHLPALRSVRERESPPVLYVSPPPS